MKGKQKVMQERKSNHSKKHGSTVNNKYMVVIS